MWLVSIQASQAVAFSLSEALEFFSDSVAIVEDKTDQTIWHVHALTMIQPIRDKLENLVKEVACVDKDPQPTVTIEEMPDKDWVAENQKTFTPLNVGQFYIHDTHHHGFLPQDKICLQIDASTAFGTGHHGTTQGCLEALDLIHTKGTKFKNIIDIGTGTGILAIACAKLFGLPIIATDNDAEAIQKAAENMRVNKCESQVKLIQAEGLSHPDVLVHQPFDLVIANILANTLIELAPSIAQVTRHGSILILSGLLQDQIDSVLKAFHERHFQVTNTIIQDGWATLTLT
jgi:ribosomal protein L11 methyltransferase